MEVATYYSVFVSELNYLLNQGRTGKVNCVSEILKLLCTTSIRRNTLLPSQIMAQI